MKRKLLLALTITLCTSSLLKAENFKLTSEGFINKESNTPEYVIEVPGVSKENLFKSAKLYIASNYSNYNNIATDVENEYIIINSQDDNKIHSKTFTRGGEDLWKYNYQYKLNFEDGKVIFEPGFKELKSIKNRKSKKLNGALFCKNGKAVNKKLIREVENRVNDYTKSLENNIRTSNSVAFSY